MSFPSQAKDHLDLQLKRRRAGVEQIALAAELGIHQGTLSRFEVGRLEKLPGGRGRKEYLTALDVIVRLRQAAVA